MALVDQIIFELVMCATERYWLIDWLPKKSTHKNQLLLVRFDLIGDFVIWLDSAKEFRKLYPSHKITLFANSLWAPLAERLPYWDHVFAIDVPLLRADDAYRLKTLLKACRLGANVAINPTYSREYVSDLVIRASGAEQRIAHAGDCNNITTDLKTKSDTWYTKLVPAPDTAVFEFNLNAALIRALGIDSFQYHVTSIPKLAALPPRLQAIQPYCVIIPGASWLPKAWPINNFTEVAIRLKQQFRFEIVLCGTMKERALCDHISRALDQGAINIAGETDLIQLTETIRGAAIVVTNDSGSVHLAAATSTPSVCILGGGHYGRFLPYPPQASSDFRQMPRVAQETMECYWCSWRCKHLSEQIQIAPCITAVSVEQVYAKCLELLMPD